MVFDENKILVYNTLHSRSESIFNGIRCWVSKSEDAQVVIHQLNKKKDKQIFIEDVLKEYAKDIEDYSLISLNPFITSHKKIILYAQSDTLADSCSKIYVELKKLNVEVKLVVPRYSLEKADVFFKNAQLPFEYFSVKLLKSFSPDVFMVLNDWTKEVHRIFSYCKQMKVPLVCLQESIIDFGDKMNRMQFADDVFVQGVQTLNELHRSDYYITGNPRYSSDKTNNRGETALINCNFTYGVFEHERENWLSDIKEVLNKQNVSYQIVQHPRDMGKIEQYGCVVRTNSQTLLPLIKATSFVITRFSSLVHEALAQNVPVIYFNPHGEQMKYDFGFNDTFLRYAENQNELKNAVVFFESYIPDKDKIASYLSIHCIPKDGSAAENIAFLLVNNRFSTSTLKIKDIIYRVLYYPAILKGIKQMKRLLS